MAIYSEVTVRDISSTPEIVGVEYDVTVAPSPRSPSVCWHGTIAMSGALPILCGWVGMACAL